MKIRLNKAFGLILVFGVLHHFQAHSVEAEQRIPDTVDIKLPSFKVTLNTYNPIPQNESYPPIVYNDITYIAMTWNNCQRLNLFINWSEESGLSISKKTEGRSSFPLESNADVDNDLQKSYEASIPSYRITVNGKSIDNAKEAYPILSFRNITYFPLTWRFAHDEFQWMTDWSDRDGFTILTGDNLSGIYGLLPSSGDELYIQTNIYGNLKLDKSLLGNLEAAPNIVEQSSLDYQNEGYISGDPNNKHNQTRIDNGRLLLDGIELTAPEITSDVVPKDTVVSAGPAKLVSVSLSSDQNDADVYLVIGSHVELLDRHRPLYRKLTNPNNTSWITTADAIYDVHHISWQERNLWLIGVDGSHISMNKQLNSNHLKVLSVLSDGALIVSASKDSVDDQTFSNIYRVGSDGKTVKMFESQKGKIYADNSGTVYVLSPSDNRITSLNTGKSVVLNEIMMYQAAKGIPQPLKPD